MTFDRRKGHATITFNYRLRLAERTESSNPFISAITPQSEQSLRLGPAPKRPTTAGFLAFLMNICEKEHATIQYAFLSSIFSLTGRLIGGISGLGAERYGYGNYFAITFLLSMPAYLLLPWVKQWIHEEPRK